MAQRERRGGGKQQSMRHGGVVSLWRLVVVA
jgi:hypothetical protein